MFQKIKKFFLFKLSKRAFWFWMILILIIGLIFAYLVYTFDIFGRDNNSDFIKDREDKTALVESPLNGAMIEQRYAELRPYAVMVENHPTARPQTGLDKASIVYEALVEGGITRFMAVYLENSADEIGPVRSTRAYYLDWVLGLGAFYAHAGGSGEALARIITDNILDLNHDKSHFWRSNTRYAPHNLYTSTDDLKDYAKQKKYDLNADYTSGDFKKDNPLDDRPESITPITINYSTYTYQVVWQYDQKTNEYSREMAGSAHQDAKNNNQLLAKSIIVQYIPTSISTYNPSKKNLELDTLGRGKVLIFQDGEAIEGEWKKDSKNDRTVFLDSGGKIIRLVAGVHWYQIVKTDTVVSY
ncbi:MAG: DUF3048 domain-containing protein [Candidatus Komeilibacteria bacterium]